MHCHVNLLVITIMWGGVTFTAIIANHSKSLGTGPRLTGCCLPPLVIILPVDVAPCQLACCHVHVGGGVTFTIIIIFNIKHPQGPIHLNSPVITQVSIHLDSPATTEAPIHQGGLARTQLPICLGDSMSNQVPIHLDNPATTQVPICLGDPATTQPPIRLGDPSVTQVQILLHDPCTTQVPIHPLDRARTQVPIGGSNPASTLVTIHLGDLVITQAPAVTQAPISLGDPALTQAPISVNNPAVTQVPICLDNQGKTQVPMDPANVLYNNPPKDAQHQVESPLGQEVVNNSLSCPNGFTSSCCRLFYYPLYGSWKIPKRSYLFRTQGEACTWPLSLFKRDRLSNICGPNYPEFVKFVGTIVTDLNSIQDCMLTQPFKLKLKDCSSKISLFTN
jgi:hypothetical protein